MKNYATIREVSNLYKGSFTYYAIRNLVVHRDKNGFNCCIRKFNRKILISLEDFEKWIEEHKVENKK